MIKTVMHLSFFTLWQYYHTITENLCKINLRATDLAFVALSSWADFNFGDEKKDLNKENSRHTSFTVHLPSNSNEQSQAVSTLTFYIKLV